MSPDVLASAPAAALSPHTLAAALNQGATVDAVARRAPAPAIAEPMPGPADAEETVEARTGLLMFRVGPELFAVALADVDEAIELSPHDVTPLPEMPARMLGIVRVRGESLALFTPAIALGVRAGAPQAALIVRDGARRVALAVDDVEDVIELGDRDLRATPDADEDRLLLGVAHHDGRLVSAVDVPSLLAACAAAGREAA